MISNFKYIVLVVLLSPAFALTPLSQKWVKTITNPKVDTAPPTWFRPSTTEDLRYWINLLPSQKNEKQYVVAPALGMIAPIVETDPKSSDYQKLVAWKSIDLNPYFQRWAHLYPSTAQIWAVWNAVIGWHSNYLVSKRTDFTTVFGRIPELDVKDELWFYRHYQWNQWILLKYSITKSYETKATDTKVMLPTKWKREVTLYTCTPIGTARNRWILRAELKESKFVTLKTIARSEYRPSILAWSRAKRF